MDSKTESKEVVSILLVDDKPANLIALESFLDTEGYDIVSATSGREALSLLPSRSFAVILTDIMMPEMDGFELARIINQDPLAEKVPIIFLTAMASEMGDIFKGYAAGAVDYMLKPLEPEIVKAKVAVFAELFRRNRMIQRQAHQLLVKERREQAMRLALLEQQAAQELEKATAENRELSLRVELQLALAEFSRLALLAQSMDELMQNATLLVLNTLKLDFGAVLTIHDQASAILNLYEAQGARPVRSKIDRPLGDLLQGISTEREPTILTHVRSDILLNLLPGLAPREFNRGVRLVIFGKNHTLGVLSLYTSHLRSFTLDEMNFLKSIGHFLGIGCERMKSEVVVRELTRSNVELENFSFAASHDLQEPLRKIISFSQLLHLEYGDKVDENGRMYLDFIVDGAKRMKALIDDLLELSRVGNSKYDYESVSLKDVVDRALKNLEMKITESKASIQVESLPELCVNASEFVRLFQNLLSNALKYRQTDVPPLIRISCETVGANWQFCVSDQGIGIHADYLDKIFILFKRLHGRNEFPGTGIGLAICKKIVEQHGGRIWAESSGKDGSRFYFTLPQKSSIDLPGAA